MEPLETTSDSERQLADFIRAERVRFVFIQSPIPIFFSPLAAAILALALRNAVDHRLLTIWCSGLLVIAIVRVILIRAFAHRPSTEPRDIKRWERAFVASILVVDLWWGIGALLLLVPDSLAERALVFCFVMVMAGGHSASYAAHPATVSLGVLALTLPITIRFGLERDVFHRALAFTAVMYLLANFRSIRTLSYFFGRTHRLAHELQEEKERVEVLARTDFLSTLNNRRAFFQAAEESLRLAARYAHPTALLMLDIDHFKATNDRYGHAAGDAVIRAIGAIIRETFRTTDIAGRIGGEEFAVLLPETPLGDAMKIAERFREGVEARRVDQEGVSIPVTISIGIADRRVDESLEQLLARADAALYAAKNGGRNRVVAASALGLRSEETDVVSRS